jgi:hypothetical protein
MGFKSALLILVAAAAGGAAGLAKSDSQAGQDFRAELASVLSPAAEAAAQVRDQTFSSPKFVHDDPDSILQNFVVDGKQDPTFGRCLADLNAANFKGIEALASRHDHKTTVALVNCLLTHDRQRFCTADGRQQIANAAEFYLWSRDYNFNHRAELDQRYQIVKLNDPDENPLSFDPYYKTWDGPADQAIFDNLKSLARNGYVDPDAFGLLPRYEIRKAMEGLTPEGQACPLTRS